MKQPKPDFKAIFTILIDHQVDFIVVGGVCAVLHGAPISTFDLDLVHSRDPRNIDRLLVALNLLEARYRDCGERVLRPGAAHLSTPGHQLLMTSAGPLDLSGVIGNHHGYEELLPYTVSMDVAHGVLIRVLDLEFLIKVKEEAGRDKDQAVLAILRQTLKEKSR